MIKYIYYDKAASKVTLCVQKKGNRHLSLRIALSLKERIMKGIIGIIYDKSD